MMLLHVVKLHAGLYQALTCIEQLPQDPEGAGTGSLRVHVIIIIVTQHSNMRIWYHTQSCNHQGDWSRDV